MITYEIFEESFSAPETGCYTAYGIAAVDSKNGNAIEKVSDVFLNQENAIHFANMLNEEKLEPVHLKSVIDDALIEGGDFYFEKEKISKEINV